MELAKLYEQYRSLNQNLQAYLEKFIAIEEKVNLDEMKSVCEDVKIGIENMLEQSVQLQEQEGYEEDIKDLKYLMTDTLFLLMDLIQFCAYQEEGRCRMRAINYLGKRKRVEVFGE